MNRKQVEAIKNIYTPGTRVVCQKMPDEPNPIKRGTRGTVEYVDGIGTIHCKFDNGRRLGLIPDIDTFRELYAHEYEEPGEIALRNRSRASDDIYPDGL